MCVSSNSDLRKVINELLHCKKLNTKASHKLIHQTNKMIIKENLFLQLKQELHYHKCLNGKLKEYLNFVKERRNKFQCNYNEAEKGCVMVKDEYEGFFQIVNHYENVITNLHKDKVIGLRQYEEVCKMKMTLYNKLNNEFKHIEESIIQQENKMKEIINKKEELVIRKQKEHDEYIKNDNAYEKKYNMLKNKIKNLNMKSERYFKKNQKVLDPFMMLDNEKVAQEMISKENKEM